MRTCNTFGLGYNQSSLYGIAPPSMDNWQNTDAVVWTIYQFIAYSVAKDSNILTKHTNKGIKHTSGDRKHFALAAKASCNSVMYNLIRAVDHFCLHFVPGVSIWTGSVCRCLGGCHLHRPTPRCGPKRCSLSWTWCQQEPNVNNVSLNYDSAKLVG